MSNIDKQWLQQKIAGMEEHRDLFPGDLDDDHGNVLAALRIALASLEAEAVAYAAPQAFLNFQAGAARREWMWRNPGEDLIPLFTTPPAPSVDEALLHMAASAIEDLLDHCDPNTDYYSGVWADIPAKLRRAAMLQGAENTEAPTTMQTAPVLDTSTKIAESTSDNSPVIPGCSCHTCRPVTFTDMRFVVCPECGNKRCPHANDHRNACTGSNEPGQEGSAYPAAPQHEVK
ncbi:TPA: hypothetical protein ACPFP8_001646 [Enterobacter ludwigii]